MIFLPVDNEKCLKALGHHFHISHINILHNLVLGLSPFSSGYSWSTHVLDHLLCMNSFCIIDNGQ